MSNTSLDETIELYEHFFRDPKLHTLGPRCSGIACRNIRDALRVLDYPNKEGDHYDSELLKVVQNFQRANRHIQQTAEDGKVGPRTGKLLTIVVLDKIGEGFFERGRMSPEYAVFLSYARKDEASVKSIAQGIISHGIPVFRDKEAIPPGASWPATLHRSISKCQIFLCMLSPQAAGSINVLIEVVLALHAGRSIVPVLLETAELPSTLRSLLGNIQHLDLTDRHDCEERVREVLAALSMQGLSPPSQP